MGGIVAHYALGRWLGRQIERVADRLANAVVFRSLDAKERGEGRHFAVAEPEHDTGAATVNLRAGPARYGSVLHVDADDVLGQDVRSVANS
jgi:hypothetical protein